MRTLLCFGAWLAAHVACGNGGSQEPDAGQLLTDSGLGDSIRIRVTNNAGDPIANAPVLLSDASGAALAETVTDGAGELLVDNEAVAMVTVAESNGDALTNLYTFAGVRQGLELTVRFTTWVELGDAEVSAPGKFPNGKTYMLRSPCTAFLFDPDKTTNISVRADCLTQSGLLPVFATARNSSGAFLATTSTLAGPTGAVQLEPWSTDFISAESSFDGEDVVVDGGLTTQGRVWWPMLGSDVVAPAGFADQLWARWGVPTLEAGWAIVKGRTPTGKVTQIAATSAEMPPLPTATAESNEIAWTPLPNVVGYMLRRYYQDCAWHVHADSSVNAWVLPTLPVTWQEQLTGLKYTTVTAMWRDDIAKEDFLSAQGFGSISASLSTSGDVNARYSWRTLTP